MLNVDQQHTVFGTFDSRRSCKDCLLQGHSALYLGKVCYLAKGFYLMRAFHYPHTFPAFSPVASWCNVCMVEGCVIWQVQAAEDDTLRGTMDEGGDSPVGSAAR